MFLKPPPLHEHKQRLRRHTEPLCGLIRVKKIQEKNFVYAVFTKGPPPYQHNHLLKNMEPLRGLIDLITVLENNYLDTRNHYKQPLCGLIDLKSLPKKNLQSPIFITVSPHQR